MGEDKLTYVVRWIDVNTLSFNSLLLLERAQLNKFPGWLPEADLAVALKANPVVKWYLRHKCPEIIPWLDKLTSEHPISASITAEQERQAEIKVMNTINDLLVYVVDPTIYDAQPFLSWDSDQLREMADFNGKVVIDVGSGTGRLAFVAAEKASMVFAVEPVGNLRQYIKQKAKAQHISNIFPVDGVITDLSFPTGFADISMGGHVYGDYPEAEYAEMRRVTKPGGMILLCPGTSADENIAHEYLISQNFVCADFHEPSQGALRKYWKVVE